MYIADTCRHRVQWEIPSSYVPAMSTINTAGTQLTCSDEANTHNDLCVRVTQEMTLLPD